MSEKLRIKFKECVFVAKVMRGLSLMSDMCFKMLFIEINKRRLRNTDWQAFCTQFILPRFQDQTAHKCTSFHFHKTRSVCGSMTMNTTVLDSYRLLRWD